MSENSIETSTAETPVEVANIAPAEVKHHETPEQAVARILGMPMSYPPFKRHEAAFRGNVVVQILRGKLTKAENGKDMIIVEGVVLRTKKLEVPPSQYPANNPEGWDAFGFGESEMEFTPKDPETGTPLLDENGQPQVGRHFPPLGPMEVTGYRFTYGDELTKNEDGSYFWRTERLVNNARFLGWRPGRTKAPRTGTSLTDFTPDEGKDWVSAEDLGMTGQFGAYFEKEEVKEDSRFAPRLMLVSFKLLDTRVTKVEAESLTAKFDSILKATRDGSKYDGRKIDQRKANAPAAAPSRGRVLAAGADQGRVAGAPAEFCGKPCGQDRDPCMEKPGHDAGAKPTVCKPAPF